MDDELQSGEADEQGNGNSQEPINQEPINQEPINNAQSGQIPFDQPAQPQPTTFTQQPNFAGGQSFEQPGNVGQQSLEQPGYGYPPQFAQTPGAQQVPQWGSAQQEAPNQWSGNQGADGQQVPAPEGVPTPGYPFQTVVPPQGVPPQGYAYAPGPVLGQPVAKKSQAPLIIGIVVAALAVIAIIIAVVVRSGVFGPDSPTSDDYLEGQSQVSTIEDAYTKIGTSITDIFSVSYGDGSGIDAADVDELKAQIKEFEDASAKFGELKVVDDEGVKQSYDAYMAQAKQYVTFTTNIADSTEPLSKAATSCSDVPTASSLGDEFYDQYEEYINTCQSDLDAMSDVPDPAISSYASAMGDYIGSTGDIIGRMEELGSIDSIEYGSDEYTQLEELISELSDLGYPTDAATQLTNGLTDEEDEADPSDALNDLYSALQDGLNAELYE